MPRYTKHAGEIIDTGEKLYIMFVEIPGNENNALVTYIDKIDPRLHDVLVELIDEAQSYANFGEYIHRKPSPYGDANLLIALQRTNSLVSVPHDKIIMVPHPSTRTPMADVIKAMRLMRDKKAMDPSLMAANKTNPPPVTPATNPILAAKRERELIEALHDNEGNLDNINETFHSTLKENMNVSNDVMPILNKAIQTEKSLEELLAETEMVAEHLRQLKTEINARTTEVTTEKSSKRKSNTKESKSE